MVEPSSVVSKNGTIEVLRFIFAISIVGIHLYNVSDLSYFKYGHYGVEYFFLVGGLFMAYSIEKHLSESQTNPGKYAFEMIIRKIKRIYPYVILVTVLYIVFYAIPYRGFEILALFQDAVNLIPYLVFANITGLSDPTVMYLEVMWYLSAMFIAMLILAPIYIKYPDYSKRILFPLGGCFILGYLVLTLGTMTYSTEVYGGISLGLLRAVGEMALGASCYSLATYLGKTYSLTTLGRITVLILEITCFTILMGFIGGNLYYLTPSSVVFLVIILVTLVYSGLTWNLKCGKVVAFLGNISLPLYLTHMLIISSISLFFGSEWFCGRELLTFLMIIGLAIAVYAFVEHICPRIHSITGLFVINDDSQNHK